MKQKSSLREVPQLVSGVLTGNNRGDTRDRFVCGLRDRSESGGLIATGNVVIQGSSRLAPCLLDSFFCRRALRIRISALRPALDRCRL
jgi:hypothetical protein